jgi:hypothetical protein
MALADLVTINSITITHGHNNTVWTIAANNQSYGIFEQLIIEEGIFGTVPSGILVIRDPSDAMADFNFSGKDLLTLNITDRNGQTLTINNFYIYQVSRGTDYIDKTTPKLLNLKFVHESYFFNERVPVDIIEDIKLISDATANGDITGDSWVKDMFSIFFPNDTFYVSKTTNYAWLKNKPITYPAGTKTDQIKVLNLLNYLAENSNVQNTLVSAPVADVFFWKDLVSTNFISLSTLIQSEPVAYYTTIDRDSYPTASDPNNREEKIDAVNVTPNISFMELENAGTFGAYYERIDPNFENPYFKFLDDTESVVKKNVIYRIKDLFPTAIYNFYTSGTDTDYPLDFTISDVIKFDDFRLEYLSNNTTGVSLSHYSRRVYPDSSFGYYDESYYNSSGSEPSYSYYSLEGITAPQNTPSRNSVTLWQTMYDIDEADPFGDTTNRTLNIPKVYISIKKALMTKNAAYFKLRKLKEKWNVFKNVVCCINTGNDSFMAIITGSAGLTAASSPTRAKSYAYSWEEVEAVPKVLGFTTATTLDFEGGFLTDFAQTNPNFFIKKLTNGRKGTVTPRKFEAYNINEYTNKTSGSAEYGGPGTNFTATGYPAGLRNVAVGSYPNTTNPCNDVAHGQLVKMFQVDIRTIRGLTFTDQEYKNTPVIYMFETQNDKEGQCETC